MTAAFTFSKRVEFSDTDMAGIMHFSRYFIYMEMAEHAFWRSLGLSVHGRFGEQKVSWPRIHVECDYRKPLRFEDEVEIRLTVKELAEKTVTFTFIFIKNDGGQEIEVAEGLIKVICVRLDGPEETMSVIPIPAEIRNKLEHG